MTDTSSIAKDGIYPLPVKLLLLPLLIGAIIVLLNLQWMHLYQLINAPKADSLVYLTEAYNDYWTFRGEGVIPLVKKYTAGNQITSPLLWWLAGIMFLMFGLDPANAYLVIGIAYLLWVTGVIYLAWQLKPDRAFALACGLMAVFLPSAVWHGLRHFMLDFVAAAPFVWATGILLKCDLFSNRKASLSYGLLCGITVLFRTTSFPYFLGHAAILLYLSISRKRHPNYFNTLLAGLVILATCGWFIFSNLPGITSYYGYWFQEAGKVQASTSFFSNLFFYFKLLPGFHLSVSTFMIYLCSILIAFAILLFLQFKSPKKVIGLFQPLLTLILMAGIPTVVLSLYPSRAATVDYPFIAAYLILPMFLWRKVFSDSRLIWIPAAILIGSLAAGQSRHLFRSPAQDSLPADFREREAIQMILDDAEQRELPRIKVGNTCIHQHNCLSYKYWVLSNYFLKWRGRFDLAVIGRAKSPEELAAMNKDSDYVITLENYRESTHPNNRFAPEANRLLKAQGMKLLGQPLDLPDGTTLHILWNPGNAHVKFIRPDSDGWHKNHLHFTVSNSSKKPVLLKIQAELFPLSNKEKGAFVAIKSANEPDKMISFTSTTYMLKKEVLLSEGFFNEQGKAHLVLSSSWAFQPEKNPENPERRALAFRNLAMSTAKLKKY